MEQLVIFCLGDTVTDAWKKLLTSSADCGKTCYGVFNSKVLYSTDTLDQAYEKVTGLTKSEFDAKQKAKKEEYMRKDEERRASMPEKIEKYKKDARGVILESQYQLWDEIVPIRLDDLYHGMELDATLDICKIMREESVCLEDRVEMAKKAFDNQGHSGMSASLVLGMIKQFCPHGIKVVEKCR